MLEKRPLLEILLYQSEMGLYKRKILRKNERKLAFDQEKSKIEEKMKEKRNKKRP